MNIKIKNFGDLHLTGVYSITNTKNNKIYIGSTTKSFKERWITHIKTLRKSTHLNKHLQSSFNLFKEDCFLFEIIEIEKNFDKILELEQYYIDKYDCCNPDIGYNQEIDVYKRTISQLTKEKISNTLKKRYSLGEITYKSNTAKIAGWNKGIKCPKISKTRRNMFDSIMVCDADLEPIVIFRSCIDLCEWSKNNNMPNLVLSSNNKIGAVLRADKIYLSIRTNTPYKGLFFRKVEPLSPAMGIAKWMNSGKAEMLILSQALDTSNEGAETTGEV